MQRPTLCRLHLCIAKERQRAGVSRGVQLTNCHVQQNPILAYREGYNIARHERE